MKVFGAITLRGVEVKFCVGTGVVSEDLVIIVYTPIKYAVSSIDVLKMLARYCSAFILLLPRCGYIVFRVRDFIISIKSLVALVTALEVDKKSTMVCCEK